MTICFFGNYQKNYPRNHIVIEGLQKNNIKVIECQTRERGVKKFVALYAQHRKLKKDYDFLWVAFSGFSLVWFAKILTRKPILFDAFVSLYMTNVLDRKVCSPNSLGARYYSFLDWMSCRLANKVLLDTEAHIRYYTSRYKLKPEKFVRIFAGAKEAIFFPAPLRSKENKTRPVEKIIIHWHGYIVPFHAVSVILEAARILSQEKDVEFHFITRFNQAYQALAKEAETLKLNNIIFYPETDYTNVAQSIRAADICLGIFSDSIKAATVIPNKIYEGAACAKPVITADHDVVKEVFTDRANILLCRANDPRDLAEKIMLLKKDPTLRAHLGENAGQLFRERLTAQAIVREILPAINATTT